ncbi:MAG: hypothetical protein AMXMBFR34_28180 [Myxococcaceae bacterium]
MKTLMAGVLGVIAGGVVALWPSEAKAANCECWGYYTCTSTQMQADYDEVGCGIPKTTARNQCLAACSGGTCVDSGWFC